MKFKRQNGAYSYKEALKSVELLHLADNTLSVAQLEKISKDNNTKDIEEVLEGYINKLNKNSFGKEEAVEDYGKLERISRKLSVFFDKYTGDNSDFKNKDELKEKMVDYITTGGKISPIYNKKINFEEPISENSSVDLTSDEGQSNVIQFCIETVNLDKNQESLLDFNFLMYLTAMLPDIYETEEYKNLSSIEEIYEQLKTSHNLYNSYKDKETYDKIEKATNGFSDVLGTVKDNSQLQKDEETNRYVDGVLGKETVSEDFIDNIEETTEYKEYELSVQNKQIDKQKTSFSTLLEEGKVTENNEPISAIKTDNSFLLNTVSQIDEKKTNINVLEDKIEYIRNIEDQDKRKQMYRDLIEVEGYTKEQMLSAKTSLKKRTNNTSTTNINKG
jgi:hypothetical protein